LQVQVLSALPLSSPIYRYEDSPSIVYPIRWSNHR
jgi:hypothetical protein